MVLDAPELRSPAAVSPPREALEGLCRLVFNLRLFAVAMTLLYLPHSRGGYLGLSLALVVAGLASIVPLVWWRAVAPRLLGHPVLLFVDLVLAMGVLSIMGADSPFFYFTLGTAMLAGVLHEATGAVFFSIFLVAGYWLGLGIRAPIAGGAEGFRSLIGFPALYLLCAAGGVALRRLLIRYSSAEARFRQANSLAAVNAERARMAREMHDSLAKTLQGISLKAAALPMWLRKDPARAEMDAKELSQDAAVAAAEARSLITDLRSEMLDRSLDEAVRLYAVDWAHRTKTEISLDLDRTDMGDPVARWEVFSVLREALTNVERHSRAEKVNVSLVESPESIELTIRDDGRGFEIDLDKASQNGHYGILGMRERAAEVGGRLDIDGGLGRGATVTIAVPLTGETPATNEARSEPRGGELSWSG